MRKGQKVPYNLRKQISKKLKGRLPWNTGKKLKQFCPKGHDTFKYGRNNLNDNCIVCMLERGWVRYGIVTKEKTPFTYEDYTYALKRQEGKCAMCARNTEEFDKAFAVDHCHETGIFRDLLCIPCNSKLGIYEKNKKEIETYIKEHIV